MKAQGPFSEVRFHEPIRKLVGDQWEKLSVRQKSYAKKIWGVITYKWRWQIAMNVPYLAIFILDRTIPAVHKFDMALLSMVTSKLPIPEYISSWIG